MISNKSLEHNYDDKYVFMRKVKMFYLTLF